MLMQLVLRRNAKLAVPAHVEDKPEINAKLFQVAGQTFELRNTRHGYASNVF
jgi:hypothetical protein